jgi:hypothetical protein
LPFDWDEQNEHGATEEELLNIEKSIFVEVFPMYAHLFAGDEEENDAEEEDETTKVREEEDEEGEGGDDDGDVDDD